ncbi:MAG TPA: phosphoribosylformylglycinamidine synthase subunit PurS, partial [Chloroflexi bacterium]|nr:phosphoribosylformylglycinamidine synthase subunit PurS [Chloroflexota bacterium]
IRVGKHIEIEVQAKSEQNAAVIIDDLCKKILINPIVESYEFKLFKI